MDNDLDRKWRHIAQEFVRERSETILAESLVVIGEAFTDCYGVDTAVTRVEAVIKDRIGAKAIKRAGINRDTVRVRLGRLEVEGKIVDRREGGDQVKIEMYPDDIRYLPSPDPGV
jgi:hypothetical protein